jgi:ABC-type sugar transport system substrate-binding protein
MRLTHSKSARRAVRGALVAAGLASALALSACGTMAPAADQSSGAKDSGEKVLAINFPGATANVLAQNLLAQVEKIAGADGWRVIVDDPEDDLNKQVSTLTTWIQQDVDVIIAQPIAPDAVEGIAKQAMDAGIGWITYGLSLEHENGFVGFDHVVMPDQLVEIAENWAAEKKGFEPKIAILTWTQIEWARQREAGFEKAIEKRFPGAEIVARQDALSQSDGLTAMSTVLQAHPEVNMVFAIEETASEGAYQALLNAGHAKDDPDLFVGGIDGSVTAFQLIQDGTFYRGSSAMDLMALANGMVDAAKTVEGGEDKDIPVPSTEVITGDPRIPDLIKLLS